MSTMHDDLAAQLAGDFTGLSPAERITRAAEVAAQLERFLAAAEDQGLSAERAELAALAGAVLALRAVSSGY